MSRAFSSAANCLTVRTPNARISARTTWCRSANLLASSTASLARRFPTGIFYAQGVKTNVLFFTRSDEEAPVADATEMVWVYDMRANMPAFGKTRPLTVDDFADFEVEYGNDPNGGAKRTSGGPESRWRCFTREEIAAQSDNLDITWLRDDSGLTLERLGLVCAVFQSRPTLVGKIFEDPNHLWDIESADPKLKDIMESLGYAYSLTGINLQCLVEVTGPRIPAAETPAWQESKAHTTR